MLVNRMVVSWGFVLLCGAFQSRAHANHRSDDFSSTAYWYQTEPHKKPEPLPPVKLRLPDQTYKIQVLEKNLPN